jgi:hypothetical protein
MTSLAGRTSDYSMHGFSHFQASIPAMPGAE